MKSSLIRTRLSLAGALLPFVLVASCKDTELPAPPTETAPVLLPGEVCDKDNPQPLRLTFDPPSVVVAPGESRPVRLTIEPDACEPNSATFVSAYPQIAAAPETAKFDLRHATYDFKVVGGEIGRTTITVAMEGVDDDYKPKVITGDLPIHVRDRAAPTCAAGETKEQTMGPASETLIGPGSLATSSLAIPPPAFTRTDEYMLPSFPASITCAGEDLTAELPAAALRKLGPAVTFGAKAPLSMAKSLRREVELTVPVNPAAFPSGARLRHLQILYKGPRIKKARPIPVANARVEALGDGYVLKFQTPWFGTYQAAVVETAGLAMRSRRITNRAVIGFSMGGGGAAVFGMRHHDKFDAIAPLGGPSDWTWLLWYLENNALGGFCPAGQTCPKVAPNRHPMEETYAHTMDFENWFYQPGGGNGGNFPRSEYVQIFEDLALAMGNPNGSSTTPDLLHMALGPKRSDPWMTVTDAEADARGLPRGTDCSLTVEPIGDDPDEARQKEIDQKCKAYRCDPKHAWKAPANYFDDEYNPDGTLPVISFCDGAQLEGASPYRNQWAPGGNKPVNLALAVDLNDNGIRDEGEPVIRSGHESFDDCGADGLCNPQEPGYDPETNPDPNQDDYDYQLNPTGLEGNHRHDPGEPFRDYGLDGVPNTATRHVAGDPGEGDGQYTESVGLANFYKNDAHSMLSRRVTDIPGGPVTDDALRRIDVLSDGGVRDLFNFATVANHLTGQIHGRLGPTGLPLRSVSYYNGFNFIPGQPVDRPRDFNPSLIRWADVASNPSVRYGDIDATESMIKDGDGQHVGTALQLLHRLMTAFFYAGQRWPNADRRLVEDYNDDNVAQLPAECSGLKIGTCEKMFTGPRTGRTGPIAISLPPGYALKSMVEQNVRYPVLYILHGYGQDPRDLKAVAIFTDNFMNVAQRSYATRLPKFIIVYVDGRCRVRDGKPECIRGTFYMDSARPDGPQLDAWFDEVTDYVDQNYRTMPASDVDMLD
ncbi:MAG: hypothetical protein KF819_03855 [Labilithrix sp.]|nr:hypothetical protein [Labilithrix sp.]